MKGYWGNKSHREYNYIMAKSTSETRYTQSQVDVKLMTEKLTNIEKKVIEIDRKLEAEYVTKDQQAIVKSDLMFLQRTVYGLVGLIITAVVGGAITFFINAPK